jgi:hypothetical protein
MGDILDRWIGKVEDALIASGENENADDFDEKVRKRLDDDLASMPQLAADRACPIWTRRARHPRFSGPSPNA